MKCHDVYNQKTWDDVSFTLRCGAGNGDGTPVVYGLRHQPAGGGCGNAIGFLQKQSAAARSIGEGPISPTLSQDANNITICYDGYNQRGHEEISMTLRSAMTGTEGNDADPKVAYGINPVMSGVMMETKPAEETAQTLRKSPGSENGIVQTIGFKAGQSADGGLGDEREVSPTLSHKPYALEPTLAQSQCDLSQMRYIVRRLMPTEAERLMGLPDGYTIPRGLRITDELVSEFQRIFDTFGAIMAEYEHTKPPKPKSANQVRAWLEKISNAETCPDSPRYKACGNGWATNQPRWITMRILAIGEGIDPFTGEELNEKKN